MTKAELLLSERVGRMRAYILKIYDSLFDQNENHKLRRYCLQVLEEDNADIAHMEEVCD